MEFGIVVCGAVVWEHYFGPPFGVAVEGFLEADAFGAGDGEVERCDVVGVLDIVAPVEESCTCVELVACAGYERSVLVYVVGGEKTYLATAKAHSPELP